MDVMLHVNSSVNISCVWKYSNQKLQQAKKNNWSRQFDERQHRTSCRCWRSNDSLAAAETFNAFQWAGQLPKLAPFCGDFDPI